MDYYGLEFLGDRVTEMVKNSSWFPFKSGNLKYHATTGAMYDSHTYRLHFSSIVAPYLPFLEEGTKPHDIPRAFGYDLPFGIGGRFDGKFHSGSTKHQGFIRDKAMRTIVDFIATTYQGEVDVV